MRILLPTTVMMFFHPQNRLALKIVVVNREGGRGKREILLFWRNCGFLPLSTESKIIM
jgi:hypothetical protein